MAFIKMLSWWYSSGWGVFLGKIRSSFLSITDFFSMSSLIRTLFKPYRQISAATASANSSLDLKFHMFIDRLISRLIGFFSRLILLIAGLVIIIIGSVISIVLVIVWPFIPLFPIAGVILSMLGVQL